MTKTRASATVATAAVALGIASAAYAAAGDARDRREHPPPGRLVDAGGYQLHIVCAGEGSPPVVICPSLGAPGSEWEDVQQRVAQVTACCTYDRAGLGYSDPAPGRRTSGRMAWELHALLHNAGVQPPYILAGHSVGGFVVRVFTAMYPGEVAGLALIDSSHPQQQQRLPRTHARSYPGGYQAAVAYMWMRPLGVRRLRRDLGLGRTSDIPSAKERRGDAREMLAFKAMSGETERLAGNLGNLPLTVLSANGEHAHPGYSREWAELQDELAALSARSAHVEADHGGHHLNRDNPELVAQVIADLVVRVRADVGGEAR